jgi:hypothetical protein
MTITATAPAVTTTRFSRTPRVPRHAATPVAPTASSNAASPNIDAAVLLRWGFAVDNDGIGAHEDSARAVVDAARSRGLGSILIEILADRREPSVARQRAFGRLALALAR